MIFFFFSWRTEAVCWVWVKDVCPLLPYLVHHSSLYLSWHETHLFAFVILDTLLSALHIKELSHKGDTVLPTLPSELNSSWSSVTGHIMALLCSCMFIWLLLRAKFGISALLSYSNSVLLKVCRLLPALTSVQWSQERIMYVSRFSSGNTWLICWDASTTCNVVSTVYVLSDLGSLHNKTQIKNKVNILHHCTCMVPVWYWAAVQKLSTSNFIPGFKATRKLIQQKTSCIHNIRKLSSTADLEWIVHVLEYCADSGPHRVEESGNTWGKNIYQRLIIYSASGIRGLPQETGRNLSLPVQRCTNSDFPLIQQASVSIRHQIQDVANPLSDLAWQALPVIYELGCDGITKLICLRVTTLTGLKGTIFNLHWYMQEKNKALIILKYLNSLWFSTSFMFSSRGLGPILWVLSLLTPGLLFFYAFKILLGNSSQSSAQWTGAERFFALKDQ